MYHTPRIAAKYLGRKIFINALRFPWLKENIEEKKLNYISKSDYSQRKNIDASVLARDFGRNLRKSSLVNMN